MDQITIRGKQGSIQIKSGKKHGSSNRKSHFGGYDIEGTVEIKSGNYYVLGELLFTTNDMYEFYQALNKCYNTLQGVATFINYETSLQIEFKFSNLGQVFIQGYYREKPYLENVLQFEIESDQSFILATLNELKTFLSQYGDVG
ncbi:hypothetical protein LRO89_08895 [Priestia megaterium]|uniref:WapI family immunity protein n=1 Tax=Priestia megaterium TaxID=1404 RepID=UPI0039C285E5